MMRLYGINIIADLILLKYQNVIKSIETHQLQPNQFFYELVKILDLSKAYHVFDSLQDKDKKTNYYDK